MLTLPANKQEATEQQSPQSGRNRLKQPLFILFLATMLASVAIWFYLISSVLIQSERVVLPAAAGMVSMNPKYVLSIEGLQRPIGVAVSADGDRVYVSQSQGDKLISVFDANGRPVTSFPVTTGDQTFSPLYIAVSPDGKLYITDSNHKGIHIFSKGGKYVGDFQPKTGMSDGWAPLGLSFDKYGDLLVTDVTPGKHRVLLFGPDGTLKLQIGKQGNGPGEFQYPNSVIRADSGYIFVADSNNGRIQAFDISGNLVAAGSSPTLFDQGGLPRGLALDYNGHLYATDTANNVMIVCRVTNGTVSRDSSVSGGDVGLSGFSQPNAIAMGPQNRLYVVDRENNRVVVLQLESGGATGR